jgi:hypothetical protein
MLISSWIIWLITEKNRKNGKEWYRGKQTLSKTESRIVDLNM